jgi:Fe-S cluster biogenesis protein NfuA
MTRVRETGARIENLLAALSSSGDAKTAAAAEEMVRLLVGMYGEGLEHIVAALRGEGAAGRDVLARLTADPVVESLLLVHDLHPEDVDTRIRRALERIRPFLGPHADHLQYLGVGDDGTARLRLEGDGHGSASAVAVRLGIKGAIEEAAPEISGVVVEAETTAPALPLLQIGRRP